MLIDTHTHSSFSCDSQATVDAQCDAAFTAGLAGLCFCEHVDHIPGDASFGFFREGEWRAALDAARERAAGRLQVLAGVEFGEPHRHRHKLDHFLEGGYDYVLGAVHWVGEHALGNPKTLEKLGAGGIWGRWYRELLAVARVGAIDALAHFDLPKRYLGGPAPADPLVDEILAMLVAKDIALEVNTSPLRQGHAECSPDRGVLERYAALGGTRITLASDAHVPAAVGAGLDTALSLVRAVSPALVPGYYRARGFIPFVA